MKCPPKKSHTYTRCIWTNQTRINSVSNGFCWNTKMLLQLITTQNDFFFLQMNGETKNLFFHKNDSLQKSILLIKISQWNQHNECFVNCFWIENFFELNELIKCNVVLDFEGWFLDISQILYLLIQCNM